MHANSELCILHAFLVLKESEQNVRDKPLEVNFFSAYLFQECQEKCICAINEVKIDLLIPFFTKKRARAHFCSDSFKTKKMHVIYIILSSHAKISLLRQFLVMFKHCLNFPESNTFYAPPL